MCEEDHVCRPRLIRHLQRNKACAGTLPYMDLVPPTEAEEKVFTRKDAEARQLAKKEGSHAYAGRRVR